MNTSSVRIIDGGLGRELARSGAPFKQPEWSALALIEAPSFVSQAHRAFIDAGAQVITTNSYAVVPFHIGEERFEHLGLALAELSGRLAREAADGAAHPVQVAGSLPPALGSYRPDLFEPAAARRILEVIIAGLKPHVDIWLAETQSAIAEVELVREVLGDDSRPLWVSFTLADELVQGRASLRSGESVTAAAQAAERLHAEALLFNCSRPEVMAPAVAEARAATGLELGVYANAFEPGDSTGGANVGLSRLRADTDPQGYLEWARQWVDLGASLVGGCCGIGPEHIACLSAAFKSHPSSTR